MAHLQPLTTYVLLQAYEQITPIFQGKTLTEGKPLNFSVAHIPFFIVSPIFTHKNTVFDVGLKAKEEFEWG